MVLDKIRGQQPTRRCLACTSLWNLVHRKLHMRNWVTGRGVLAIKQDKDGNFLKTKT